MTNTQLIMLMIVVAGVCNIPLLTMAISYRKKYVEMKRVLNGLPKGARRTLINRK